MDFDTEMCIICLAMDCKMYPVKGVIQDALRILINISKECVVCWECHARLRSTVRLQFKARTAQELLTIIHHRGMQTGTETLTSINREQHRLTSDLKYEYLEPINIEPVKEEKDSFKLEANELNNMDEVFYEEINSDMYVMPIDYIKEDEFIDENGTDIDNNKMPSKKAKVKKKQRSAKTKSAKSKKSKADVLDFGSRLHTKKRTERMKEVERALSVGFKITQLTHEQQLEEFERKREHRRYLRLPYKCTLCLTAFSKEYKYNNHMTRHNEEWGKYECGICKIRTKTLRRLRKHIVGWHSEKYSCRQCKMFTKNRSAACRHLEWHSGTVFKCPLCPAEFAHSSTYLSHRRLKHVSEYVCELCGYSFIGQRGIQTHKYRMHPLEAAQSTPNTLEGPHCAECDVRFVSQEAYNRHLALSAKHSSDDTLRKLRDDGKLPSLLKQSAHIEARRALIRRPITCELCAAVVQGRMAYAWHFRKQHPGEKRRQTASAPPLSTRVYLCDKCGKTFTNYNLWWSHMLVHSVEKRFRCQLCGKQFSRHNTYATHVQKHSDTRERFECPECGQGLSNKGNLARHLLIHGGQRPYKCSSCEKSFNNSDGLRAHTNHVHLKIPWPTRVRSARRLKTD